MEQLSLPVATRSAEGRREGRTDRPTLKFYRSSLPFCFPRVFRYIEIKSTAAMQRGELFRLSPRRARARRPDSFIVIVNAASELVPRSGESGNNERNERHERTAAVASRWSVVGRENGPQIARNVSAAFPQKLPLFPSLSLSPSPSQVAFKTSQIEGNAAQIMMVFIAPVLRWRRRKRESAAAVV